MTPPQPPPAPFEPAQRHTPHATPGPAGRVGEPASRARSVSRAGLFRSLGGILAERGADTVENTKDRFSDTIEKSELEAS